MRIAQVAPLMESVPPKLYGGTERVVSYLTEELVRQGHDVTLFASGDSRTSAQPRPGHSRGAAAQRLSGPGHRRTCSCSSRSCGARASSTSSTFTSRRCISRSRGAVATPHVTTLHGRLDLPELVPLYREFQDIPVVSISDAQRAPLPDADWVGHGVPRPAADLFRYHAGPGAISRSSAASRRRSASIARSRLRGRAACRCESRPRSIPPISSYFEQRDPAAARRSAGRVHRRDR